MKQEDLLFIEDTLPFWKLLTKEQRLWLIENISLRHIPSGSIIHGGTGDCDGLFLVRKGQARAFILSESGKEITLYRLFERDICIFSANCVLKNISFDVMVEAEKQTEAFLIPTHVYKKLLEQSLAVSDYTNQLMSSKFSDVMWLMEQILFMRFDQRLAMFLIEQSNIEDSDRISLTHEAISKHLGSAREVVTRMLKYFAGEGMVELYRGGILIKDRKKLQNLI